MKRLSRRQRWKLPTYLDAKEIQTGKVEFNPDLCTACGRCARSCPVGAIIVPKKASERGEHPVHLLEAGPDLFMCFACSNCVTVCPQEAIKLVRRYTTHYYYNRLFRTPDLTPPRKY